MVFFLSAILIPLNVFANKEPAERIYGHIYDSYDLKPVTNAEIIYSDKIYKTDSSGLFSIEGITENKVTIKITHPFYYSKNVDINFTTDSIVKIDVYLVKKFYQTPVITITDYIEYKSFSDYLELTNLLQGKELERNSGLTLANTLKNETGISLRSMGPAPSRPVYRGLSGERIYISEDGRKSVDLSGTSPDHALALESFTVNKIEVLRGPKVLTKTSNSTGGIINSVRNDIPFEQIENISFTAGTSYETVNEGILGAFRSTLPVNNFNLYLEGSKRNTSDMNTPTGVLKNSYIKNYNYSGGFAYNFGRFQTGGNYREYNSEYGIPGGFIGAHPDGVNIKLNKKQFSGKFKMPYVRRSFSNLTIDYSYNRFSQTEFELNNIIGADFRIREHIANLEIEKFRFLNSNFSKSGLGFEYKDFNIGGFVFTPPVKSYKISGFEYLKTEFGKLVVEASGRYEFNAFRPQEDFRFSNDSSITSKNFNVFSLSVSGLYHFDDFFIALNLSKTSKSPGIEELYSQGPHLAAYSYETGNINLESENGYGIELSGFYSDEKILFTTNLFSNIYSYFITPRNTGDTNFQTLLPIYTYQGSPSLFAGIETSLEINLPFNLIFKNGITYTYGQFSGGKALPNIPPLKSLWELRYEKKNLIFGINAEIAGSQNRVDEFETPTAGYGVMNSFAQISFLSGKFIHNFSLSLENIFNKEYRNHLSRIKSIIPEAGRNFKFIYKLML